MKSDTAIEATLFKALRVRCGPASLNWNEGLFAKFVPSPAWRSSLSKDFWNVIGHAKFMLNHNRNPVTQQRAALNNSAFVSLWFFSKGTGLLIRARLHGCFSEHPRPCSRLDLNRSDLFWGQGLTPSRCHDDYLMSVNNTCQHARARVLKFYIAKSVRLHQLRCRVVHSNRRRHSFPSSLLTFCCLRHDVDRIVFQIILKLSTGIKHMYMLVAVFSH